MKKGWPGTSTISTNSPSGLVPEMRAVSFTIKLIQSGDSEIKKAGYKFICYCNIAACLVTYINIIALVLQSLECAAHADDIIIGVRREEYYFFGKRISSFRVFMII